MSRDLNFRWVHVSTDDYKDEWLSKAFRASCLALRGMRKPFTIEELRVKMDMVDAPLDLRWWGDVTLILKREKKIKKLDGGRPAKSSNYSMKPLWVKA